MSSRTDEFTDNDEKIKWGFVNTDFDFQKNAGQAEIFTGKFFEA